MLYGIYVGRQSRRVLPYPGPRILTTTGGRMFGSTDGGQVMDGDALYFRDPLRLKMTRNQILRAACLFEIFDLKDCAAELLVEKEKEAEVDAVACLDLLAGGNFRKYMEAY